MLKIKPSGPTTSTWLCSCTWMYTRGLTEKGPPFVALKTASFIFILTTVPHLRTPGLWVQPLGRSSPWVSILATHRALTIPVVEDHGRAPGPPSDAQERGPWGDEALGPSGSVCQGIRHVWSWTTGDGGSSHVRPGPLGTVSAQQLGGAAPVPAARSACPRCH